MRDALRCRVVSTFLLSSGLCLLACGCGDRGTKPRVDTTPPGIILSLEVGSRFSSSVELKWTAMGDDGDNGTASQYDLRYAKIPLAQENWSLASQVIGETPPLPAGQHETFTVTNLAPETTYYFGLKAADEMFNWSEISNIATTTTLPAPDGTALHR